METDPPGWKLTAADAIDAEDFARLLERVQGLPAITRRVVTLRKVYGLDEAAIAASLGLLRDEVLRHMAAAVSACADFGEIADA